MRDTGAQVGQFFTSALNDLEQGRIEVRQIDWRERIVIIGLATASAVAFVLFMVSYYTEIVAQYLISEDAFQFIANGGTRPDDFSLEVFQALSAPVALISLTASLFAMAWAVVRLFRTKRLQ